MTAGTQRRITGSKIGGFAKKFLPSKEAQSKRASHLMTGKTVDAIGDSQSQLPSNANQRRRQELEGKLMNARKTCMVESPEALKAYVEDIKEWQGLKEKAVNVPELEELLNLLEAKELSRENRSNIVDQLRELFIEIPDSKKIRSQRIEKLKDDIQKIGNESKGYQRNNNFKKLPKQLKEDLLAARKLAYSYDVSLKVASENKAAYEALEKKVFNNIKRFLAKDGYKKKVQQTRQEIDARIQSERTGRIVKLASRKIEQPIKSTTEIDRKYKGFIKKYKRSLKDNNSAQADKDFAQKAIRLLKYAKRTGDARVINDALKAASKEEQIRAAANAYQALINKVKQEAASPESSRLVKALAKDRLPKLEEAYLSMLEKGSISELIQAIEQYNNDRKAISDFKNNKSFFLDKELSTKGVQELSNNPKLKNLPGVKDYLEDFINKNSKLINKKDIADKQYTKDRQVQLTTEHQLIESIAASYRQDKRAGINLPVVRRLKEETKAQTLDELISKLETTENEKDKQLLTLAKHCKSEMEVHDSASQALAIATKSKSALEKASQKAEPALKHKSAILEAHYQLGLLYKDTDQAKAFEHLKQADAIDHYRMDINQALQAACRGIEEWTLAIPDEERTELLDKLKNAALAMELVTSLPNYADNIEETMLDISLDESIKLQAAMLLALKDTDFENLASNMMSQVVSHAQGKDLLSIIENSVNIYQQESVTNAFNAFKDKLLNDGGFIHNTELISLAKTLNKALVAIPPHTRFAADPTESNFNNLVQHINNLNVTYEEAIQGLKGAATHLSILQKTPGLEAKVQLQLGRVLEAASMEPGLKPTDVKRMKAEALNAYQKAHNLAPLDKEIIHYFAIMKSKVEGRGSDDVFKMIMKNAEAGHLPSKVEYYKLLLGRGETDIVSNNGVEKANIVANKLKRELIQVNDPSIRLQFLLANENLEDSFRAVRRHIPTLDRDINPYLVLNAKHESDNAFIQLKQILEKDFDSILSAYNIEQKRLFDIKNKPEDTGENQRRRLTELQAEKKKLQEQGKKTGVIDLQIQTIEAELKTLTATRTPEFEPFTIINVDINRLLNFATKQLEQPIQELAIAARKRAPIKLAQPKPAAPKPDTPQVGFAYEMELRKLPERQILIDVMHELKAMSVNETVSERIQIMARELYKNLGFVINAKDKGDILTQLKNNKETIHAAHEMCTKLKNEVNEERYIRESIKAKHYTLSVLLQGAQDTKTPYGQLFEGHQNEVARLTTQVNQINLQQYIVDGKALNPDDAKMLQDKLDNIQKSLDALIDKNRTDASSRLPQDVKKAKDNAMKEIKGFHLFTGRSGIPKSIRDQAKEFARKIEASNDVNELTNILSSIQRMHIEYNRQRRDDISNTIEAVLSLKPKDIESYIIQRYIKQCIEFEKKIDKILKRDQIDYGKSNLEDLIQRTYTNNTIKDSSALVDAYEKDLRLEIDSDFKKGNISESKKRELEEKIPDQLKALRGYITQKLEHKTSLILKPTTLNEIRTTICNQYIQRVKESANEIKKALEASNADLSELEKDANLLTEKGLFFNERLQAFSDFVNRLLGVRFIDDTTIIDSNKKEFHTVTDDIFALPFVRGNVKQIYKDFEQGLTNNLSDNLASIDNYTSRIVEITQEVRQLVSIIQDLIISSDTETSEFGQEMLLKIKNAGPNKNYTEVIDMLKEEIDNFRVQKSLERTVKSASKDTDTKDRIMEFATAKKPDDIIKLMNIIQNLNNLDSKYIDSILGKIDKFNSDKIEQAFANFNQLIAIAGSSTMDPYIVEAAKSTLNQMKRASNPADFFFNQLGNVLKTNINKEIPKENQNAFKSEFPDLSQGITTDVLKNILMLFDKYKPQDTVIEKPLTAEETLKEFDDDLIKQLLNEDNQVPAATSTDNLSTDADELFEELLSGQDNSFEDDLDTLFNFDSNFDKPNTNLNADDIFNNILSDYDSPKEPTP